MAGSAKPMSVRKEGECDFVGYPSGENDPVDGGCDRLTYGNYLQLDRILDAQQRQSEANGNPIHDEMLFIVIHQAYELWFKQVLFELNSVRDLFRPKVVSESHMLTIDSRLTRINKILQLLVQQFSVLETMTPDDFLSFRGYLGTSSGFQSVQFRILENILGVTRADRIKYHSEAYTDALQDADRERVLRSEEGPSLLQLIEAWLERTPGVDDEEFQFAKQLHANLNAQLEQDRARASACEDANIREALLHDLEKRNALFATFFDNALHEDQRTQGNRRLSHRAFQAVLFIHYYRHQPRMHMAFQLLSQLEELDANLMTWRLSHVNLVQRMLGTKAGSGGETCIARSGGMAKS